LDYIVNNIQFVGRNFDELWIFGYGGVSRVKWNLPGINLNKRGA
jgi:hypothetical protein